MSDKPKTLLNYFTTPNFEKSMYSWAFWLISTYKWLNNPP